MKGRWVLVVVLAVLALVASPSRRAWADASTAHSLPVVVLTLDSDDAEEQADALTAALRSRVRASQGWSLVETSQSLGMLTAALRCTGKPISADCEQKIGEQIKAERYIFGYVTKGPQAGQVTAEVRLYQKGKPDTIIKERYADNLKEQNDDTLRKVAQKVLDGLGGRAVGVLVVRFGSENGELVIDGDKRVPLQHGSARLELSPGSHSVEVVVAGQPSQKRNVLVTAGKETPLTLTAATAAEPGKPDKPFPTRKVVGGGLAVLGLVAGTISVINLVGYLDDQQKGEDFQNGSRASDINPKLPPGKSAGDVCGSQPGFTEETADICKYDADAKSHSAIALGTGIGAAALLGIGAYLLFTDGGSEKERAAAAKPRLRATPAIGMGSGGFVLSGSF